MPELSPEAVRSEVARFWNAFSAKNVEVLEDFYAHESVGFGSSSTRSEPGRLSATRRQREYFASSSPIRAQISQIDVVMVGESAAVASYSFEFHATRSTATGKSEENIRNGRATQVFAFDPDGRLRIFHEHFSLPAS
jgi:ketosteroid isomerase-like protein